jgi:hypothetical protein
MAKANHPSPCCGRRSILIRLIWGPGVILRDVPLLLQCAKCGKEWTDHRGDARLRLAWSNPEPEVRP